jgi:hypothetical protein
MEIRPGRTYRNKKNKKLYRILYLAVDVTDNECKKCVVYVADEQVAWVRRVSEFEEKFEEVNNQNCC